MSRFRSQKLESVPIKILEGTGFKEVQLSIRQGHNGPASFFGDLNIKSFDGVDGITNWALW